MKNHYIVIADRGHLRIFNEQSGPGQFTPTLDEIHAMDFPHARMSYTEHDSDMAGRFQSSKHHAAAPGAPNARSGMSIDERLPMQNEVHRREAEDVARAIDAFFDGDPTATWDFAADTAVHNAILDMLSPQTRFRLRTSISKDLVKQPASQLHDFFKHPQKS